MNKTAFVIIILMSSFVLADTQWNNPQYYDSSYCDDSPGYWIDTSYGIDSSMSSRAQGCTSSLDQWIIYSLSSSQMIGVNLTTNEGTYGTSGTVVVTLSNATGSKTLCSYTGDTTTESHYCANTGNELWTKIKYRYTKSTTLGGRAYIYDIRYGTYIPPVPAVAPGACRTFCDYEMEVYPPYPNNISADTYWRLGLTNTSLTSPEGLAYLTNTWTNVKIDITNGTCANPGRIYNLSRLTTATPNYLWANYTYGDCPPKLNICFNGTYNTGYTYQEASTDTSTDTSTKDLVSDSFRYYHYNLSYKNEITATNFNFSAYQPSSTTFICSAPFDGFTLNLPISSTGTSYILQTKSVADLSTTLSNNFNRKLSTDVGGVYNIYLLNSTDGPWDTFTFTLYDYASGIWQGSTLNILTSVNNTMSIIHSERFSTDGVISVMLRNNTLYKLQLNNTNGYMDLGIMWLDSSNKDRKIIANKPNINEYLGNTVGLTPGWTWDYASGQVGATISSDISTNAVFSVYDTSLNPYNKTYTSSGSGTSITFSYTVPDKLKTYFLDLEINDTRYGSLYYNKLVLMYNQSMPMNTSALAHPLPGSMLELSTVFVKSLISAFVIIVIFFAGCKASSYGIGMIMGSLAFSFAWYVNFVPQSEIPFWFCVIMVLLSVMTKMMERGGG